jgi:hypothetical protein
MAALPFGTNDFIEYWSAYQLYRSGQNPYDPALLLPIQQSLGWTEAAPLMMWNPPWTLALLSPILQFDFLIASRIWIFCNLALLLLAGLLTWQAFRPGSVRAVPLLAATLLFYPAWNTIALGQTSLLLTFALAASFFALIRDRDLIAGMLLSLLTVKPHLCYLLVLVLTWFILKNRRFGVVFGFLLALSALLIITTLQAPGTLKAWLGATGLVSNSSVPAISVHSWITATLPGILPKLLESYQLPVDKRLITAFVPMIVSVITLVFLIRYKRSLDWSVLLAPLLSLTLFTAPFGWVFDHVLLVIVQVLLIARAWQPAVQTATRFEIALWLFAAEGALLGMRYAGFRYHHHFFWLGFLFLLISLRANRLLSPGCPYGFVTTPRGSSPSL